MKKMSYFMISFFYWYLCGCSPKTAPTKQGSYQEDLSGYRIKYKNELESKVENAKEKDSKITNPTPTNHDTPQVDALIDSINYKNSISSRVNGFTIQVYSGSSREEANNVKNRVYKIAPDSEPEIAYVQPYYKIKVGQFVNRVEAQKLYSAIKLEFPDALVIPDKFTVKR